MSPAAKPSAVISKPKKAFVAKLATAVPIKKTTKSGLYDNMVINFNGMFVGVIADSNPKRDPEDEKAMEQNGEKNDYYIAYPFKEMKQAEDFLLYLYYSKKTKPLAADVVNDSEDEDDE